MNSIMLVLFHIIINQETFVSERLFCLSLILTNSCYIKKIIKPRTTHIPRAIPCFSIYNISILHSSGWMLVTNSSTTFLPTIFQVCIKKVWITWLSFSFKSYAFFSTKVEFWSSHSHTGWEGHKIIYNRINTNNKNLYVYYIKKKLNKEI